jgi:hypothetical protein
VTTPEPLFLTVEEVVGFHADQNRLFGGTGGIRLRASLESAVAMPQASFGGRYLHADLFEMAAAYAFHIAEKLSCTSRPAAPSPTTSGGSLPRYGVSAQPVRAGGLR